MAGELSYEEIEKHLRRLEIENDELRKSQKSISASEEFHRATIENISDTVIIANDHGKLIYVCPNTFIIFGLSRDEVYQLGTIQTLLKGSVCSTSELKERQEIKNIEWSITDSSGNERFLLINVKSANIQGVNILYTMRDITDRKKSEISLKESEKKYRTLFNKMAQGAFYQRADGILTDCNQAALDMFGLTRDQFLGKTSVELQSKVVREDGSDLPRQKHPSITALQTGKPVNNVITGIFNPVIKDYVWLNINAIPEYKSGEDKPYQVFVTMHDITQRKKAENEKKKQREFLRKSQEMGQIGTWELDLDKNKLVWTEENYKIFGLPFGTELTYEIFLSCVHPDDRQYVDTEWKASLSGKPYDIEHRLLVDGRVKWVREKAEIIFSQTGEAVRGTGFTQDITERKQSEESVWKLKECLESLWNVTKIADEDIMAICNHVLNEIQKITKSEYAFYGFLTDNDKTMELHAWSSEAMKDCRVKNQPFHFPIDKAGVWADAVKEKRILTLNHFQTDQPGRKGMPDGHVPLTRLLVVPVVQKDKVVSIAAVANKKGIYTRDDEKQIETFLNSVQILIDRKISIQKQLELTDRLKRAHKMEAIGTIAGGIAHDFNNILYMITGNAELAMEYIPESNPVLENLKEIKSAGLRASGIVKQLLQFSRQSHQSLKPIGAVLVIQDALKFIRSILPSSVEIKSHFPKTEINILGDSTQIHQAIMNLCINASQVMEKTGGIIDIQVDKITNNQKWNDLYPDLIPGAWLKIVVSDTGPGIETEIIERIFDPYFTTKSFGEASGMGLSIVHGIVKNHHGVIFVNNRSENGAVFTIFIPVNEAKSTMDVKTLDKIPRGNGEKILFVDDEIAITKMAGETLERLGYRVDVKTNPVDALALFRSKSNAFDLVITDMTMPQMTGVTLAEKLKKIHSDILVIICTGHSSLIDEESAKSIGIDAYAMKPIVMKDIAKTIRDVLDKKNQ